MSEINKYTRYNSAISLLISCSSASTKSLSDSTTKSLALFTTLVNVQSKLTWNDNLLSSYLLYGSKYKHIPFAKAEDFDVVNLHSQHLALPLDQAAEFVSPLNRALEDLQNVDAKSKMIILFTDHYASMNGGSDFIRSINILGIQFVIVSIGAFPESKYLDSLISRANYGKFIDAQTQKRMDKELVQYLVDSELISENDAKDSVPVYKPEDSKSQAESKGEKKMNLSKIFGANLTIGRLTDDKFKGSYAGLAIKGKDGCYVSYDGESITDVTDFVFDGDVTFAFPAFSVAAGDLVFNNNTPVYVKEVNTDGSITVVNPTGETIETILPKKTIFGFKVYVKVFSMFAQMMPKGIMGSFDINNPAEAGKANPIAMMAPIMMMGMFGGDSDSKDGLGSMMPLMFLPQIMGAAGNDSNPFAAMFGGAKVDESNPMAGIMQMIMPMMILQQFAGDKSGKNQGNGFGSLGELMPLMMLPQLMAGFQAPVAQKVVETKKNGNNGRNRGKNGSSGKAAETQKEAEKTE